jgi:hypothetical protein
MLKINLEKELLRQNKKIVTPKELLLIREYDKLGDAVVESPSMKNVFGEHAAVQGASIKSRMSKLQQQTSRFDKERVFHISQIETLCDKYYLRFLPSKYFKGAIDKSLPSKINQFEIAHNVKCDGEQYRCNTFIAAPKESFVLEERPKDPLLFFKINNEYYYLIHKWGNDISIFRRAKTILSKSGTFNALVILPFVLFGAYLVAAFPEVGGEDDENLRLGALGVILILAGAGLALWNLMSGPRLRFVRKNDWNSTFRD